MTINNTVINTFKISLAAVFAIVIATLLKLDFAVSAGIVAILSVAPTKKETIRTALGRFYAFVCALVISYVCFLIGGFNIYSFFVYLLIFIFVCQRFKWISAMAMDSVLVSHFLTFQNMKMNSVGNEVLLFVIGVSFGILVNLHLRKNTEQIEELKDDLDEKIKYVLLRTSTRIMELDLPDYDGSCFDELWDYIEEAERVAQRNYLNEIKSDYSDKEYISMRRRQVEVLTEIFKHCSRVKTTPETGEVIAQFIQKVSEQYSRGNTVVSLLDELSNLKDSMKDYDLPQNRKEFEDRAELYAILQSLKEFLEIKKNYMISKNID